LVKRYAVQKPLSAWFAELKVGKGCHLSEFFYREMTSLLALQGFYYPCGLADRPAGGGPFPAAQGSNKMLQEA
jgi:hypothetical protein